MEINEGTTSPQTNTQAALSLVFGVLTTVSFCTGIVPIPFTGFICFPLSFLFGILSLIFGAVSLNQIRLNNETGSPMAWTGIIIGGLVFMCLVCMMIAFASFFIFAPNYIPTPHFFGGNQL